MLSSGSGASSVCWWTYKGSSGVYGSGASVPSQAYANPNNADLRIVAPGISDALYALLTSPVTDLQIIVGKFLGAMGLFVAMLALTLIHTAILFLYGNPAWKPVVTGYIGLILMGGCFLSVVSAANTAMQLIVADHMRGRVLAVRIMLFTLSFPVGSLIQGWVSDQIGPRATVLAAARVMLAVGLVLALRHGGRALARLDDPHDEHDDEPTPGTPNSTLRHNGWSFDPPGSTLRRDPSHPRSETQ